MSFATIGDGYLDPLMWAKKPKSNYALQSVFDCARSGDQRFAEIKDNLISDGVCDESGILLQRWDGLRWVMVSSA